MIVTDAGFSVAGDITADGVTDFTRKLSDAGKSNRTIGAYITAIKGFARWMSEKLRRDPLATLKKPSPNEDRKHERRCLLQDEWGWLRRATLARVDRWGMSGPERVLLYAVAIQTGLRSNELRSLTRGRLFLDLGGPYITCKPASTKNSEMARQYIHADVASQLAELIARKSPRAPLFHMPNEGNVAAMLRGDLAEAREAWLHEAKDDPQVVAQRTDDDFLLYENHDGEKLDFHALRHTCGVWLAIAGTSPKGIQAIMRHSSITLTLDTYGHLIKGEEAASVAKLPVMMPDERSTNLRNGTTDHIECDAQHQAQQSGCETVRAGCDAVRNTSANDSQEETPNSLPVAKLSVVLPTVARVGPLGFEPRLTDSESVVLPLH